MFELLCNLQGALTCSRRVGVLYIVPSISPSINRWSSERSMEVAISVLEMATSDLLDVEVATGGLVVMDRHRRWSDVLATSNDWETMMFRHQKIWWCRRASILGCMRLRCWIWIPSMPHGLGEVQAQVWPTCLLETLPKYIFWKSMWTCL